MRRALAAVGDGVGNVVQATPLIRALHDLYDSVDVYCHAAPEGIEGLLEWVGGRVSRDPGAFDGREYEVGCRAFCAAWPTSGKIAWQMNRPHPHTAGLGEAENEFLMARALGFAGSMPECLVSVRPVEGFVLPVARARVIGVCDGSKDKAGPYGRTKRWPGIGAAVRHILEAVPGSIALVVGSRSDGEVLPEGIGVVDCRGLFSLAEVAWLLSRCGVFVGNDSGLSHVAAAVGTPSVVVFGPTPTGKNLPPRKAVAVVRQDVPCRPCIYSREQPAPWTVCKHECMTRIEPAEVALVARALLEGKASTP